jgi:outer membrane protein assembly factor BamB
VSRTISICLSLLATAGLAAACGPDEPNDEPDIEGVYQAPDRQDLLDTETEWQVESERLYMSLPAVDSDGTLYAGGWDGKLYSVSPDGTINWTFETGGRIDAAPTVDARGRIIATSWGESVYVVTPDGDEAWSAELDAILDTSASVDGEGRIYVSTDDGELVRFSSDGMIDWEIDLGAAATTSVSIYEDDDGLRAYVGTAEPSVKCIEDGAITGSADVLAAPTDDIALTADGDVIAAQATGGVAWIEPDCSIRWETDVTFESVRSPVIDTRGRPWIGQHAQIIQAFDPDSGEVDFTSNTGTLGQVVNGMHVGDDGYVYGGATALIRVDADGNIETLSDLDVLSTPLVWEGAAYATTEHGELVRLTHDVPPLADTSWPTQHGNQQRTGYLEGDQ